jgi:hypothetical protein
MGYALHNGRTTFEWDAEEWGKVLDLAKEYGWEPSGTLLESHHARDWDGNYTSRKKQRVTDRDAYNMASALRRAWESTKLAGPFGSNIIAFILFCLEGEFHIGG